MKLIKIAASLLLVLQVSACQTPFADQPNGSGNMWVGDALRQAQIEAAVVVQRALQPYHFGSDSAELNELGEFELGVLAAHYHSVPGTLSLRRGGAPDVLYQARAASVVAFLAAAGVEPEQVVITDGWPGGEGMPSTRVNEILAASRKGSNAAGEATQPTGAGE